METETMAKVSHNHLTQSDKELQQLKLCEVLFPSRSFTGIKSGLSIVEIQKHVNKRIQPNRNREGRPGTAYVRIFAQHKNRRVVINL